MSLNFSLNYLYNILISLFFLFVPIMCDEGDKSNPKIIQENYFQISHLLSGQTFKQNIYDKFLICTYDSDFSNKIKIENDNDKGNQKYFLCLINSVSISYLYILNNNEVYAYKYQLYNSTLLFSSGLNLNLIPNIDKNNNLNCIISLFIPNNNSVYLQNFIINLQSNKLEFNSCFQIKDHIFINYYLGCGISEISNQNLACSFIYNQTIYSYVFDIENGNKINGNHLRFNKSLSQIKENSEIQFISSFLINKNDNIIFACYKFEGTKTICYFYNIKTNLHINNDEILECKTNLNTFYFYESEEYLLNCQNNNLISIYRIYKRNINKRFNYSFVNIDEYEKLASNNFVFVFNSSVNEINLKYDFNNNKNYKYICINSKTKNNYNLLRHIDEKKDPYNKCLEGMYLFEYTQINDSLSTILNETHIYYSADKPPTYYYNSNEKFKILFRNINDTNSQTCFSEVYLDYCKQILRIKEISEVFYALILERENEGENWLTNKVDYKLFDSDFNELNLSECENTETTVYYPLKDIYDHLDEEEIKNVSKFLTYDVNLFNLSSPFFNDFCQVYPDFEFDIIREDRIKLYLPYSACEKGCTLVDFNETTAICNCPFKINFNPNIESEKEEDIYDKFPKEFPKNVEVIKCFGVVMSSDDKINNLGFYLITFMLGGHVPIWCYYLSTRVTPINDYITKEMTKFGYLEKKVRKSLRLSSKGKKKKNRKSIENDGKKGKNKRDSSNPPKKRESNKKSVKKKGKRNSTCINSRYIINNSNDIKNKKIKSTRKIRASLVLPKSNNSKYDNSSDIMKNSNKELDPGMLETQNMENYYYGNDEEKNYDDFNFINININPNEQAEPRKESNKVLNNYTFEEAVEYDKRSCCKIFHIFLLSKNIIFRSLLLKSPFDSISVQGCAFILVLSSDLFFNSILYFNKIVSNRYNTRKSLFSFTFTSINMPTIFYTMFIVYVYIYFIFCLTNISYKVVEIFQKEEEKLKSEKNYQVTQKRKDEIMKEIKEILRVQDNKNIAFFIIEIILMLLYWYYITAFCHIYSNTQTSWIFNTFFTIVFRFIIDCCFCFLFAILYQMSISNKSKSLYNAILFIYNI